MYYFERFLYNLEMVLFNFSCSVPAGKLLGSQFNLHRDSLKTNLIPGLE